MFKQLRDRLRGVLSLEKLTHWSDQHIAREIQLMKERNGNDAVLGTLSDNPKRHEAWRKAHHLILCRVANNPSRDEQAISLRRETIELIEGIQQALPLMIVGSYPHQLTLSEGDKKVLTEKVFPGKSHEDVLLSNFIGYVFHDASCRCLRLFSAELGDVKKDDWYDAYRFAYGKFVCSLYEGIIAEAKGQFRLNDTRVYQMMLADLERKIFG